MMIVSDTDEMIGSTTQVWIMNLPIEYLEIKYEFTNC